MIALCIVAALLAVIAKASLTDLYRLWRPSKQVLYHAQMILKAANEAGPYEAAVNLFLQIASPGSVNPALGYSPCLTRYLRKPLNNENALYVAFKMSMSLLNCRRIVVKPKGDELQFEFKRGRITESTVLTLSRSAQTADPYQNGAHRRLALFGCGKERQTNRVHQAVLEGTNHEWLNFHDLALTS